LRKDDICINDQIVYVYCISDIEKWKG
jgi:hypothetical protein